MSLWGQSISDGDENLRFSGFTSINWNTQRTGFANGGNMGFRFRKSIKLLPGLKINLTHKGISSASIGKPGASLNIGKKGTRTSVGIPGTGLSYSKHRPYTNNPNTPQSASQQPPPLDSPSMETSRSNVWLWVFFGIICFIVGAVIF